MLKKILKVFKAAVIPAVMVDTATIFFDYIYISGWFFHPLFKLKSIEIINISALAVKVKCNLNYPSVYSLGKNLGWNISLLLDEAHYPDELLLRFKFGALKSIDINLSDLIDARMNRYDKEAKTLFDIQVALKKGTRILDIGGRDRSKVDRSKFYPGHEVTVLDILPGDNVDVVGDAHRLSNFFPKNNFDFIVSTSVFEHLHSPWKVILEANKVLKKDGMILIATHQTIGIHDQPWDFWRFSDESWKALFNKKTGFELLRAEMSYPSYIIPFLFRPDKIGAEKSAGFELSVVLAKKISDTQLDWDIETEDVTQKLYPKNEDGFDPLKMKKIF